MMSSRWWNDLELRTKTRASAMLRDHQEQVWRQADRLFVWVMLGQWLLAIAVALGFSDDAWAGKVQNLKLHLDVAVALGGVICVVPLLLAWLRPGRASTRQVMAVAQMLWSALLIHLTGGRVETHFHVFASLVLLSFYRDWRLFPTASVVVLADHLLRGLFFPESVYGVVNPEWWRFLEDGVWVGLIDALLVVACLRGAGEMEVVAERRAHAEVMSDSLEELVGERTNQLAEAQEIAHVGNWDWNLHRSSEAWSPELYRIVGLDPTYAVTPATFPTLVHPDDRARVGAAVARAIEDKAPFEMECRVVRPKGDVVTVHARGRVVLDAAGEAARLVGTMQDVTEQRRLQHTAVFAERMSSVGTLATGVAHEINNPLAYVMGNMEFVAAQLGRVAPVTAGPGLAEAELLETRQALSEARQGASRVRDIVRDLKMFARSNEERSAAVDLRMVLDSSVSMAWNEIRHRARLVKDYQQVPAVIGNESRLGQVFLNLLVNAAQAIPEGHAAENIIHIATKTDKQGRAVVEVLDTGKGIPAEVRPRIFDPFFTTKPVGEGTGLGLSICHGIVASMGGEIEVESTVGTGTLFRVVFQPAPAQTIASAVPAPQEAAAARARVLIVDDEPLILTACRRLIGRNHDVMTANSGAEALGFLERGERFDVILCDVMMPQMTGMDLHQIITGRFADQAPRMVFVTGGAFTPRAREFLDSVPNQSMEKPLDAAKLQRIVARVSGKGEAPEEKASSASVLRLVS